MQPVKITIDAGDEVYVLERDLDGEWKGERTSAYDPKEILDTVTCVATLCHITANALAPGE